MNTFWTQNRTVHLWPHNTGDIIWIRFWYGIYQKLDYELISFIIFVLGAKFLGQNRKSLFHSKVQRLPEDAGPLPPTLEATNLASDKICCQLEFTFCHDFFFFLSKDVKDPPWWGQTSRAVAWNELWVGTCSISPSPGTEKLLLSWIQVLPLLLKLSRRKGMCVNLEFSNYLVDREGFQWLRWCLQEASFIYIPTIEVSIKTAQMWIPRLEVKLREDDRGAAGDQRAAGERENIE